MKFMLHDIIFNIQIYYNYYSIYFHIIILKLPDFPFLFQVNLIDFDPIIIYLNINYLTINYKISHNNNKIKISTKICTIFILIFNIIYKKSYFIFYIL